MSKALTGLQQALKAERKKRLCHAAYWEYIGNHFNGHDCERPNPYGFPLALVSWMHHQGQAYIKVSNQDDFGRVVDVAATKEDWEFQWIKCARYYGEKLVDSSAYGEVSAELIDGCIWIRRECCDELLEAFVRTSEETELEMVKSGYVPTGLVLSENKELWVHCSKVESTK